MIPVARNLGLDIARAGAILLVLFYHLVFNILSKPVGLWWYTAYLGVDIFFALSGFLIGSILIQFCVQQSPPTVTTLRQFLSRRALRTWPLYFIMLVVTLLTDRYLRHRNSPVDYTYFFFLQSFAKPPKGFYGESWSLCVEEWFYFSFAVGLWLFMAATKRSHMAIHYKILIFTLAYITICTIVRLTTSTYTYNELDITIFRLDAIGYGVLAALFNRFYKKPVNNSLIGATGFTVTLIGVVMLLWHSKTGNCYILYYNIAGPGLAICVLFCRRFNFSQLPGAAKTFATFTSKISYSLYLLNLPVIYALAAILPAPMRGWPQLVISIACITLLSYITYRFIEQPFLRLSKGHSRAPYINNSPK